MNKYKRIAIILIILIIAVIHISTTNYAIQYTPSNFGSAIGSAQVDTGDIKDIGGEIVGIIQIIGTAVSVGIIIFIGIKYVLGSAEEKASYKKTLLPYFVGAVLIFGSTNVTQIIYDWANNFTSTTQNATVVLSGDAIADIRKFAFEYNAEEWSALSDDTIKEWLTELEKTENKELDDWNTLYSAVVNEHARRGL